MTYFKSVASEIPSTDGATSGDVLTVQPDGSFEWGAPSGGIESVVAGTNISVDNTDPANPVINSLSDRYKTTSTTSNTIVSSGSLTFTVDAGLSYIPLQEVLIVHDTNNHMHGSVTSYSGTTMIVDIKHKTGSGTYSSWTINLDGTPVDALTGSGTVGELATFTAAQALGSTPIKTINGNSLVGSGDIVITDTYSFTFYGGF